MFGVAKCKGMRGTKKSTEVDFFVPHVLFLSHLVRNIYRSGNGVLSRREYRRARGN